MLLEDGGIARETAYFGKERADAGYDTRGCGLEVMYAVHADCVLKKGEGAQEGQHKRRAVHVDGRTERVRCCWSVVVTGEGGNAFLRDVACPGRRRRDGHVVFVAWARGLAGTKRMVSIFVDGRL